MALICVLPGFAIGFDPLSRTEDFPAVHAGAVFQRNTFPKVILILVMWAVTATITCHTDPLEKKEKCLFR